MRKSLMKPRRTRNALPWQPFQSFTDEMERFFNRPLLTEWDETLSSFDFAPICKLKETDKEYIAEFDIPGLKKDDISVDIDNNTLSVSGERKEEREEKGERKHFSEVNYGSFMRTFTFPTKVNPDDVNASYDNGVLTVKVEKTEPSKSKHITVN